MSRARDNLYGTLFDALATATHVVCPICGKSSSLKSFPAGGGTDIVLQTFQGLGRGKGFSVVSRESGIDDRELAESLKPKLLELLSVLAAHGHITTSEIGDSVRAGGNVHHIEVPAPTAHDLRATQSELTAEKKTREFLERELTELQIGMTKLIRQWREAERRAAVSERRLDNLRDRTDRLVAATRAGVESLGRLRSEMKNADRGTNELADHVQRMHSIVEAVQALRMPQKVVRREPNAAHDAR